MGLVSRGYGSVGAAGEAWHLVLRHSVTFPDGWVLSLRALFCQATYPDRRYVSFTRQANDRHIESSDR